RERCLAAGMDDYLSKPIRADELYAAVEGIIPEGDDAAPRPRQDTPTGAEQTMDQPPLDWKEALDRIGGSEETLREMAQVFLDEPPKMLRDIRAAIDGGAAADLRRAAHLLKGSAGLFQADPTVEAALRLERLGESEQSEGAKEAWGELE